MRRAGPWLSVLGWVLAALAIADLALQGNFGGSSSSGSAAGRTAVSQAPRAGGAGGAVGAQATADAGASASQPLAPSGKQLWEGSGKVAVMYVDGAFDPANAPLIGFALGNALGLLPTHWGVEVHTQGKLPPAIATRFRSQLASGRLVHRVLSLPRGKDRGQRRYTDGKQWAFTDPAWWTLVGGETVLLLHQTATLCSGSPHDIDAFAGFDYVGAPWKWAKEGTPYVVGGNGALSIRSKRAVLRVLAEHRPMKNGEPSLPPTNEDMFFVRTMVTMGGFNVSDREAGRRFSVEEVFYEAPLGVSYAMRTLTAADRSTVLRACPEARALAGYLPGADWIATKSEADRCAAAESATPDPPCPWK